MQELNIPFSMYIYFEKEILFDKNPKMWYSES